MKSVIKELIIFILLVVAILLVLGVLLYDYIPMNKVVPQIEQYEAPANIQEELEENIQETEDTMSPIVYEINESDLNLYEKSNDYQKGNVNPFADVNSTNTNSVSGDDNTTNSTGSTGNNTVNTNTTKNTVSNTSTGNTTSTNTNSEGSFLPSTGTK